MLGGRIIQIQIPRPGEKIPALQQAHFAQENLPTCLSFFPIYDFEFHDTMLIAKGWKVMKEKIKDKHLVFVGSVTEEVDVVVSRHHANKETCSMFLGKPAKFTRLSIPHFQDLVFYKRHIYALSIVYPTQTMICRIFIYDILGKTKKILWKRFTGAGVKKESALDLRFSVDRNIFIHFSSGYNIIFPNPLS
jgi:hypothetical protein